MKLQKGNLVLRSATETDAEQLASWWNDGSVMAHAGFPMGLGITVKEVAAELSDGSLIIEEDSIPIGEASYRKNSTTVAEIGIKICSIQCQNRGVGKRVLSMLINHLFEKGYREIVLDTNLENKRAQHVYESLGFQQRNIHLNSWTDQLGRKQSSVDYFLIPENFIDHT